MTIISEDGTEQKKTEINKLSGWLYVSEINDNCRKLGVEGIGWKLKAVTFCAKTKQLFISSSIADEQEIWPDNPVCVKSPSLDNGSSPKSDLHHFGGRSTRPRLDSQSSYGFKQFFSRKLAISRSRSVGKVGSQKLDASSPKSPNAFWASWRSTGDESTCLDDEAAESSINLGDPNLSIIRPIHPSVLNRQYCFQVITPLDMRYFCCRYEEEYYSWLRGLNSSVQYDRDEKIRLDTSLSIWIFEAKGVPVRKKYFCEILLDKILFSRTTAKCKHDMLFWGEQFSFEDLPPTESATISLFRESDTKKKKKPDKNVFVGSSVLDLVNLETNTEIEKWVSIHIPGISPKLQQKTTVSGKTELPSIRTKLKYETSVVLPLSNYDKLLTYINEKYLVLTSTLEMSISLKTKDILAQTLLKILLSTKKAEAFLVDVIMNEVKNTTDENLTFRGNSLATKSIDTYMKMIGKNYIQETLVSFINSVYELEGDTEVDPQKLTTHNGCLSDNQKCLIKLVEEAWRNIFLSIQIFPKNLQLVFSMVRKQCELLERDIIAKKIVSASLFLRLLCPAILSPSLFSLSPEYPCEKVSRTLTLVAKTIQNLANFTRFGSKEGYMEILNDFVEREIGNMDNFLQRITYEPDGIEDLETSCPSSLNIDLARELAVIYHLLSSEINKLQTDSAMKLSELKIILDDIQRVYESSPKAEELRLCRPFASVALVCSKPLTTPTSGQRDDTPVSTCGEMTPSSTVDESEFDAETPTCYLDTSHTLLEDSLPACLSTPREKSELTENTSILIHSNQTDILTKNTFVNTYEVSPSYTSECKCVSPYDDTEDSPERKKVQPKSPIRTPELKLLKNEKHLGNRNNHSFDANRKNIRESGTVKDRINMFSKRSESLPAKGNDASSSKPSGHTKSNLLTHSNNLKQLEQACNSRTNKITTPKKPAVTYTRQLPKRTGASDLSKASTQQKANHTEKVLPRQSSIDDDLPYDEQNTDHDYYHHQSTSKEKGYPDRAKLKLHTLQKEHYFDDVASGHDSMHFDDSSDHKQLQSCCDKVKPRLKTKSAAVVSRHHGGKRQASSCEPRQTSSNLLLTEKDIAAQRRYSEMTSRESEKKNFNRDTMVVAQSTEIKQIHSNGYCEILHEGLVERASSTMSSCSSNCSYSSESYFSDEEYGTYITGDSLAEALRQSGHGCDTNMIPSAANPRHSGVASARSTAPVNSQVHTNGYNCDDEVEALRLKLRDTELLLKKTQVELKSRTENFEQTVIRLKDKLIEADTTLKAQRAESETKLKDLVSRLLYVEGELHSEQEHYEMKAMLNAKQKMIEIQDKRIKALEGSNIRLLRVLADMRKPNSKHEDEEIDELLDCLNNRGTPTPDTNSATESPREIECEYNDIKHV